MTLKYNLCWMFNSLNLKLMNMIYFNVYPPPPFADYFFFWRHLREKSSGGISSDVFSPMSYDNLNVVLFLLFFFISTFKYSHNCVKILLHVICIYTHLSVRLCLYVCAWDLHNKICPFSFQFNTIIMSKKQQVSANFGDLYFSYSRPINRT